MTILRDAIVGIGIPGGWEWFLILAVVLIFFGKRIPGVARSLGSGINEFKTGLREGEGKGGPKELDEGEAQGPQDKGTPPE